tara:strand:+ start:313 stop:963 length:651 start_codon:yes stop_codon:yes gene_type:complete
MGIFYFPSNFVYWRKLPNHENIKKTILNFIDDNPQILESYSAVFNGKSSYNNTAIYDFFSKNDDIIKSVIMDSLDEAVHELNSNDTSLKTNIDSWMINSIWCSKYDEKSVVSCHNHEGGGETTTYVNNKPFKLAFSIIYVVNDTNASNQTEFIQTTSHGVSAYMNSETRFKTSEIKDIGEGSVLVFPTNLYHLVNPVLESGRVIISANISSHFVNS